MVVGWTDQDDEELFLKGKHILSFFILDSETLSWCSRYTITVMLANRSVRHIRGRTRVLTSLRIITHIRVFNWK